MTWGKEKYWEGRLKGQKQKGRLREESRTAHNSGDKGDT